ncbi:MAG: 16S rRNA (cytosine1402-N4)-methyltransferase [Candidatus Berkelbacteria bacterium Licking1014_85]|uniref:Ribosomal RNA small subunit methyltransferase H n=1 Tax=Candidatus Berkelbacteria bacterium Licking1014_85 TaxID=2017148 RepID=A0A554LI23_9BACT|nr:MAG: 16S rRNA (cytosine1402-N4)-methyltransferase [Candidatus Berkelbacteria bacterium Licking1014_85]
MPESIKHIPVLANEVVQFLLPALKNDGIFVDGTVGGAGHIVALATGILNSKFKMLNKFEFIGIDKDLTAIEMAKKNLKSITGKNIKIELIKGDYGEIVLILRRLKIEKVNAILLDLGASSMQFDDGNRGFSLNKTAKLDMRFDTTSNLTAYDVVNKYNEKHLMEIIYKYGEERFGKKIANAIVNNRPIETTTELAELIEKCIPPRFRKGKIHPATQTFQAIRIEVNHELESLQQFLNSFDQILAGNGRVAIISFHSLEDKMVKDKFRELELTGKYKILTDSSITPTAEEINANIRSRSAKMRVIEKIV